MGKSLYGIRGVPFKKIVLRENRRGRWIETLSCGHKFEHAERWSLSSKRRCYSCRHEYSAGIRYVSPKNPSLHN